MPTSPLYLLDLPAELLLLILKKTNEQEKSTCPEERSVAIKTAAAFSQTCRTLYTISKPHREKQHASLLLLRVLRGEADEAFRLFSLHAASLFTTSTEQEYAAGFEETLTNGILSYKILPGIITSTPFKAAFAAGDWWMLQKMTPFFNQHYQKAVAQLAEQFPNDFKYPPSAYDFNAIATAITNNQDATLVDLLTQFRKDMVQDLSTIGYRFNLNHWLRACEVLDQHYQQWSEAQRKKYFFEVVGYLQRLLPAVDVQAMSQTFAQVKKDSFSRNFTMWHPVKQTFPLYPLDQNPKWRLGKHFAVAINSVSQTEIRYNPVTTSDSIRKYITLKEEFLTELAAELRSMAQSQDIPTQKAETQEDERLAYELAEPSVKRIRRN